MMAARRPAIAAHRAAPRDAEAMPATFAMARLKPDRVAASAAMTVAQASALRRKATKTARKRTP